MFLFCNEDKKKKERLNSVLKTTHNLIKKNDIKDVRKNPVYSLIRAMSNYHLYDIVPSLTVGKIKMATNPVNMGSVAVFYFVTICAIL